MYTHITQTVRLRDLNSIYTVRVGARARVYVELGYNVMKGTEYFV
jgi:hypothetical protein